MPDLQSIGTVVEASGSSGERKQAITAATKGSLRVPSAHLMVPFAAAIRLASPRGSTGGGGGLERASWRTAKTVKQGPYGPPMRMDLNLATLLAYGVLLAVLSWKVAAPFWAYILLGLLITVLAFPVFDRLRGWLGRPRVAAALTVLIVVAIVIVPLSFLAWRIVADMAALVSGLTVAGVEQNLQTLLLWSHDTFGYPADVEPQAAHDLLRELIPSVQSRLASWIPGAITSTATFLVGIVVTIIVAYYGLINGEAFIERIKRASPMDDDLEERFLDEAKATVDGVIWGQIITAALQGGLGYVAFFITGIPNAFFWAFVMAVLSFLPLVGAFLVWAPAAVFLFATGQTGMGIFMVIWGVAVISSVDNIVKPMIIGKSGALHPVLAFIGVLGGLTAFGIMGFLMGPLVLSLFAAVFNLFAETGWNLDDWDPEDASSPGEGDEDEGESASPS